MKTGVKHEKNMSETMMALGPYRFALNTATYQTLRRKTQYCWAQQARLAQGPAHQYIGMGNDTIDLQGVIYPHYRGGLSQLNELRQQAQQGEPHVLVDGLGHVWGQWVVLSVDEDHEVMHANGQPQKVSFRLQLAKYVE